MKILIVNTIDSESGAAKAAYRLHSALVKSHINSQMLVQYKNSDDWRVLSTNNKKDKFINLFRPIIDQLPLKFYKNRTKTFFSTSWFGFSNIVDTINTINPDIVHLHWINDGMIKIEELSKIKAPIVYSLHDMWAFTGGCHYDEDCKRYEHSCGKCKVLNSKKDNDISRKIFTKKKKIFSKIDNLTIIGLSKWLHTCAKNSTLLKDKKHINLPNPIDTQIYKPLDKQKARELWNLAQDKKLILFGAMNSADDPRKGYEKLKEALSKLDSDNIEIVIFGSSRPKEAQNFGFKTNYLGYLHDDISLSTLYSAVDVMIVPSLQENLSNAIMESLSCATPVVAFDIGGNSDMIEHKINGYLVEPFNSFALKDAIKWILENKNYSLLCQNAREKVLKEFSSDIVVKKYVKLYEKILHA